MIPSIAHPETWTPLVLLMMAFSGSAHCLAMCGPLLWSATRTAPKKQFLGYQFGRLVGYLALAAVGVQLLRLFFAAGGEIAQAALTLFWASLLVGLAVATALGKPISMRLLPARFYRPSGSAFVAGAFSALLPCGWLHAFLIGWAGLSLSPFQFFAGVGVFWLATLPAFAGLLWVASRGLRHLPASFPKVARWVGALTLFLSAASLLATRIPLLERSSAGAASEVHWICR